MRIILTDAERAERDAMLRMLDRVIQDDFEAEDGKALDRLRALLAHAEVEPTPIYVGDQIDNGQRGDPEDVRATLAAVDEHIRSLNLSPLRMDDIVPRQRLLP